MAFKKWYITGKSNEIFVDFKKEGFKEPLKTCIFLKIKSIALLLNES